MIDKPDEEVLLADIAQLEAQIKELRQDNIELKQQLAVSRGNFETFMDNSPATAFFKDAAGRLLYVNPTFIKSFSFENKDWYGKTDFELWPEKTATVLRANDVRILSSGKQEAVEEDVVQADGVHHWLTHKFRFTDAHGNHYLGGMGVDLTPQKENDRQLKDAIILAEEANLAKSEFLSLMSHELRTPLHSIMASAEQWDDAADPPAQRELVSFINYGAARLRSQVDNLVLLAETDTGTLEAGHFAFETLPLIDRISSCGRGLLADIVELNVDVAKDVPRYFYGDPYLIEHMLRTVLENACKHTEQGRVDLTVSWEQDQSCLQFIVEDTGCGMTDTQRRRIYDDVVHLSRGLDRASEGMGLGLTICNRLNEALQGDLIIDSRPGVGTRIEISIPLEVDELALTPVSIDGSHSGKVLIVEDNPVNAKVLESMILKFGYAVDIAQSGEEALSVLSSRVYNMILMDIQMPVMDGITTTRWIRRRGISTPIVAVTCNSEVKVRQRCMQHGMNDFLVKPVRRGDVLRVLERQSQE